jgi:DNA-binding transcriptional LysR family regulator
MTLEQLRIFIAVADKQHVTEAARELNLTQSATSAAIAALEARYNVKLFDRVGRGIVLTPTGRTFLSEARAVMASAKFAEQTLHDLAGVKRGSMTIAVSQTIGNYWLPTRIQTFQTAHPGIKLHVMIANTKAVARYVREGAADIGFVEGDVDDPALSIREIDGDQIVIVVGPQHPWAQRRTIVPKDLPTTAWILRETGSGTRSMFETALKRFRLKLSDLEVRLELPSNEAIRAAVESGACATAISNLVAAQSINERTLHHVGIDMPKRPFFVLRHKDRSVSKIEEALLQAFGILQSPTIG